MCKIKTILGLTLMLLATQSFAMDNFEEAKRELPKLFYKLDNPKTIYCGCDLTFPTKTRYGVDLKSCGYKVRKNAKRAARIEAEHIMPAWEFGHQLQCWDEGRRKQCHSADTLFKKMEGDLHNLYPSVGEVNGDRSNFQYNDFGGTPGMYGQCEMVIDFKAKIAQPPKRARGLVARAYLYMSDEYGIKLAKNQRRLYEGWNKMYAPDENECKRNELIKKVQGNDNQFVTEKCTVKNSANN